MILVELFLILFNILLFSEIHNLAHAAVTETKTYQKVYVGLKNSTRPQSLKPIESLANGDQFGHTVAIWDDICLISASKRAVKSSSSSSSSTTHADNDGVVFIFKQNSNDRKWRDIGVVLASSVPDDGFGESLSIYRGTAAIGAPKDDTHGANSGRVYVYYTTSSSNGQNILGNYQILSSEQQRENDYFGCSVAVVPGEAYYSHGTILVGAYGHDWDGHMVDSGAVFIFANSGNAWFQVTMIQPSQPYANGYFGWSISGYSNAVAVGAPGQESVFVFHLEPVDAECPHDRPPDQMPSACQDPHFRKLQGEPGHHTYTAWNYLEILHVQNPMETNKGELFGTSVSIINETVLTVVVGAPYDNSAGTASGAILILTRFPKGDIWNSWTPGNPNNNGNFDHERNLRVSPDSRILQPQQGNDPRMNIWKIRSNTYTTDKDGSYWMMSKKFKGSSAMERFGQSVAVSDNHIVVGTHPGASKRGSATVLVFNTTTVRQTDSPIFKGPLYMKEWKEETDLYDYYGGVGDYFGYTVGIYKETAIIGSFLTGYKSEWNIGTGAAYIYDAIQLVEVLETSTSTTSESNALTLNNPFLRVTVYSIITVLVFVVFGGVLYTLHSNLNLSVKLPSVSFSPDKEMDNSVDSMELTSSHPLNSRKDEKKTPLPIHQKRSNYSNLRTDRNSSRNYDDSKDMEKPYTPSYPQPATTKYPDNSRRSRTNQYLHQTKQSYGNQGTQMSSNTSSHIDYASNSAYPSNSYSSEKQRTFQY